jgi:hypothetical protein
MDAEQDEASADTADAFVPTRQIRRKKGIARLRSKVRRPPLNLVATENASFVDDFNLEALTQGNSPTQAPKRRRKSGGPGEILHDADARAYPGLHDSSDDGGVLLYPTEDTLKSSKVAKHLAASHSML